MPSCWRAAGVAREDVFLTTKLWRGDTDDPEAALRDSLKRLQTDYVDLYLVHWPGVAVQAQESPDEARLRVWRHLERFYEQGLCRAIGVSNWMPSHLYALADQCSTLPMLNQCEFHVHQASPLVRDACSSLNIQFAGYSPLGKGAALVDETVCAVAQEVGRSAAQVAIRWSIQHGAVTIPKSRNVERARANMQVFDFELSRDQMQRLDALHHDDVHVSWDPTHVP